MNDEVNEDQVYPGFSFPAPAGYCQMPNDWFNDICSNIDNIAEMKVVLYILRHTYGFEQKADQPVYLSVDHFMHGRIVKGERFDKGTGMSEMSVRNGLKKAEKHGYIVSEVDNTDKARIRKYYMLKLRKLEVQDLDPKGTSGVQDLGVEVQSLDPRPQDLDLDTLNPRPRTNKDNKNKQIQKDKNKKSNPFFENEDEITKASLEVCHSLKAEDHAHWLNDELHAIYAASQAQLPLFLKEVDKIVYTFQYLPPDTPENDVQNFVTRLCNLYNLSAVEQPAAQQA